MTKRNIPVIMLIAVAVFTGGCGNGGNRGDGTGGSSLVDLSPLEAEFTLPQQDTAGWSILTPSADSRLIYVSSSSGDNTTARSYLPADTEIGTDLFNPAGAILPYAGIDAALDQVRDGYPDYILLLRGDTWDRSSSITLKSGRSAAEKTVLTAYGPGGIRPLVKNAGVLLSRASYSAVIGIRFAATQRDPGSPEFVGFSNVTNISGFNMLSGYNGTAVGGVLIEDCWFDWFSGNVIQSAPDNGGVPLLQDIVIRRNLITNNYSTLSHSQGFYTAYASVLLEENIFDHNGWYQQGAGNDKADGKATMFNHNTYFAEAAETIFRGNIFSRSSSIQNKFTSNTASGENRVLSWDILIDNNFYVEGEIGISLGGNNDQDNGPRFRNIHVTNNVMTHIGRTHPTGRSLGWGLEVDDWDAGEVAGNIFVTWGDADTLTNTYAISAGGHSRGVAYRSNIIYNVVCGSGLVKFADGDIHLGISFSGNDIQTAYTGRLLSYGLDGNGGFGDNWFFSVSDPSRWFSLTGVNYASLEEYRTAAGDTTSVGEQRSYADPGRTLESYLSFLGYTTDMDGFVAELLKQSKANWRGEFTAGAINTYFREGFTAK